MYFISQNVMNNLVRNLSEFSFVWMLDVLFLSVGHYLKFKREFKNENVFVILFVKFVLWIFKEFYFCKKCVSFEREVVVWVLLMCLDSRSMLCGCNLNSNDVVKKFTNMKSDFVWKEGLHVCCVVEVRMIWDLILIQSIRRERSYALYCEECYIYYWYNAE